MSAGTKRLSTIMTNYVSPNGRIWTPEMQAYLKQRKAYWESEYLGYDFDRLQLECPALCLFPLPEGLPIGDATCLLAGWAALRDVEAKYLDSRSGERKDPLDDMGEDTEPNP